MYWPCMSVCLFVCVSVPRRIPTLLHKLDVTLGNSRGCPVVVHHWADLQLVHGFRCCDNVAQMRNVNECLYLLCAWFSGVFPGSTNSEPLGTLRLVSSKISVNKPLRLNMYF